MALGISLIASSEDSLEVEATGFSSAIHVLNWYLDDTYQGSVSSNESAWPSWTFDGLSPSTTYSIKVAFYTSAGTQAVDTVTKSFTTDEAQLVSTTYYAKVILRGNGGTYSGSSTFTFTGWDASWGSYADIDINISDPGFQKTGYSLVGWSESSSASSPAYEPTDIITIRATSDDEAAPTTLNLYAVWKSGRPSNWYWTSTVSSGSSLSLTASEWNGFIGRIQEFASYRGVSLISSNITAGRATQGSAMMASQANAVRSLINQMSPATPVPSSVSSGDIITAAFVNGLRNSLNSIT